MTETKEMESDSGESLNVLCRICARHSDSVRDLFNAEHKNEKLVDMLSFCLKQIIHEDDGLPRIICEVCGTNLIMVYEFHTLYNNSELRLREIFTGSQNKVKLEIEYGHCDNEMKLENEGKMSSLPDSTDNINLESIKTRQSNIISGVPLTRNIKSERPNKSKKWDKTEKKLKSSQRDSESSSLKIECYECFQCKESFHKFIDLQRHSSSHIRKVKAYECSECQIRFVYLKSLFRHRRQKHPKRVYECENCTEAFSKLTLFKEHSEHVHKNEMKTYRCDLCSKQFLLRLQFSCHQLEHLNSQNISCKICGVRFLQHRMLKSHIRDKHTSINLAAFSLVGVHLIYFLLFRSFVF